MTVEGRETLSDQCALYTRAFRTDLDSLKCVLPMPSGVQVPISLLADISNRIGPAASKFAE